MHFSLHYKHHACFDLSCPKTKSSSCRGLGEDLGFEEARFETAPHAVRCISKREKQIESNIHTDMYTDRGRKRGRETERNRYICRERADLGFEEARGALGERVLLLVDLRLQDPCWRVQASAASGRRGNNFKRFRDFCRPWISYAKDTIWPWLSDMRHIGSTAKP